MSETYVHSPSLTPHRTPDSFLYFSEHAKRQIDRGSPQHRPIQLVFFITGNPGLISYYHTFLSSLSTKLCANRRSNDLLYIIYGASLFGFEVSAPQRQEMLSSRTPYSLKDQITLTYRRLQTLTKQIKGPVSVSLIGHSVGTYIALEVLRMDRSMGLGASKTANITSLILLTPTIIDLALSPNGRKAAPLVKYVPYLPQVMQAVAKILSFSMPRGLLSWLIGRFVRGSEAVESTIGFLRSQHGVKQSISMAIDELDEITYDKWSDDIWGASTSNRADEHTGGLIPPAKIYLFFAQTDHWIADSTKETIIRARGGRERGNVTILVDEKEGIPHGFCIRHSEVVANLVTRWILEEEKAR